MDSGNNEKTPETKGRSPRTSRDAPGTKKTSPETNMETLGTKGKSTG
jgi:hypothetical protein